jgi:transposase
MTARKEYSKEFKLDAIALVMDQQYDKIEIAKNLGLSLQVLWPWLKEAEGNYGHAFRNNGLLGSE